MRRISRVIWKIIRGLFFIEFSRFLPRHTLHFVIYYRGRNLGMDSDKVIEILNIVLRQEAHGDYQRIFAYKCRVNPLEKNVAAWGLLFWDRHIFLAGHHDPNCDCERCATHKKEAAS